MLTGQNIESSGSQKKTKKKKTGNVISDLSIALIFFKFIYLFTKLTNTNWFAVATEINTIISRNNPTYLPSSRNKLLEFLRLLKSKRETVTSLY